MQYTFSPKAKSKIMNLIKILNVSKNMGQKKGGEGRVQGF